MIDRFLDLFLNQVFGQSFLLMPIVVFIGYLAMKQSISKSIMGAIKASVGVIIMSIGSSQLIVNFDKLLIRIQDATNISGAGLNTYPTMVAGFDKMDLTLGLGTGATWGMYTLLLAFTINLILVALRKYTKIKAVFLTGNVMLVQTGITVYIVWRFLQLDMIPTIIISAIITALYWGISSTLLIKPTKEITGGDFTIGHQQMISTFMAYKIAPKLGKPEDSIEEKKLPESLNFLQDNIIATWLVMFISVVIIFFVIGQEHINILRGPEGFNQAKLTNNLIFAGWISITLTSNIVILLSGVRMFVSELMLSFQGISEKLLPGATAAVDCAATFAFAPKSVVLGLIFGSIGQIVGVLALLITQSPVFIVPGFIPLFFDNAIISIYANKYGGWKAAAIICTTVGIIQILGSALAVSMLDLTWWQGSADYSTIWVVIIAIFKIIGNFLGIPIAN